MARKLLEILFMDLPRPFGRYTLVERIASGGTAEIYRAFLSSSDGFRKPFAIKRLLPDWQANAELDSMLRDEGSLLCLLPHQAIVQVYELGFEERAPFLAMEFVQGIDCARLINRLIRDRSPVPLMHALYIMEQVLTALDFAHRLSGADGRPLGIVHRDISPSNILLSWNGEAKVTDFGIAKGLHRSERTDAGQIRGKYSYMSPEQARGGPIDARTDIFACGIVLYELVLARRLFGGGCDHGVLRRVASAEFELEGIESLPAEIRAPVMIALSPEADSRYQSAAEMLAALRAASRTLGEIGSSLELAACLAELFPEEVARERSANAFGFEGERTRVGPAMTGRSRLMRRPGLAWRAVAMAAALAGTAAFTPVTHDLGAPREAKAIEPASFTAEIRPSSPDEAPPEIKGTVAIDSRPSGASGTLILGGREIRIVTPFAMADMDIGDGLECSVELALEGYQEVSRRFSITPESAAFVESFDLKRLAGARLYLNAVPWGMATVPGYLRSRETPVAGLKIAPGAHSIRVVHPPSGQSVEGRVALAEGGEKRCVAVFGERAGLSCR